MNTATATATETERNLTVKEILNLRAAGASAHVLLVAVEQFGLSLWPPRVGGGKWLVHYYPADLWSNADTAEEAIEKLLRQMGGQ